jgi:diacylglycerol kinase (ATP)
MDNNKFTIRDRLKSFRFAFNGIRILLIHEHNAWVHLFATICVILAGFLLKISILEWVTIVIVIGFVIALEAINSSIEKLSDFVSPEKHNQIKIVKDLSAAGVLISAITAVIVGLLVFIPKIFALFNAK